MLVWVIEGIMVIQEILCTSGKNDFLFGCKMERRSRVDRGMLYICKEGVQLVKDTFQS